MTREIKFRAIQDGKMEPISGYASFDDGIPVLDRKLDSSLMQYTGLKDSKGVEIFEGAVLKCTASKDFPDDGGIVEVFWSKVLQWQVRSENEEHGLPLAWGGWKSIEIIGNIDENPELLKKL